MLLYEASIQLARLFTPDPAIGTFADRARMAED